ncbi:hypothetical protein O1611_g8767 [Lasiodiplodia mahajangana]|uniref:Uncharacterized protein n=1 Tax=Lasiodiplodia mahajangana TaxID=1108764 RepID=A0ACC2JC65_9PEZI|nr:hypothetical protein O1611_g8767 [Lasiodiplodia mahajangana]
MPETRNITLDFKSEEAVILGIRQLFRAIADKEKVVIDLDQEITLPSKANTILKTSNRHEFFPLPEQTFKRLLGVAPFKDDYFVAPSNTFSNDYIFTGWAEQVAIACRMLAIAKNNLRAHNKEQIKCASPILELSFKPQVLLSEGERALPYPQRPSWYAELFFESKGSHGCILATHVEQRLGTKQILRSELLALLALLEIAGICALTKSLPSTSPSVFLLSFTHTQVRALEARANSPRQITISVRAILDQVPTGPERDDEFRKLVARAMYTDSADSHSALDSTTDLSSSSDSTTDSRSTSRMSTWSTTIANEDSTDEEQQEVISSSTSSTKTSSEEEK